MGRFRNAVWWRLDERLAKEETLTPPGQLDSPLLCSGPWMSTVVLYCWCHSDSASVLFYFTLNSILSWSMLSMLTVPDADCSVYTIFILICKNAFCIVQKLSMLSLRKFSIFAVTFCCWLTYNHCVGDRLTHFCRCLSYEGTICNTVVITLALLL